ncbi:MAG: tRNA (adenosine(37)-N6)-threonylcarbamoyltransferase complex ATPase subunit type 1 TsaE [Parachlamydiales bacterium]|nr:tRNA (adenosine(37)-N6)-threonylcarbamoyltransferase complex ATPase subunit type 1 TsaE [Parachlamydiales bacterium]
MAEIISNSVTESEKIAQNFAKKLKQNDVVAFFGDLGSGKTTFIKALVQALVEKNIEVTSPTFIYLNIYQAKLFDIFHFDVYRLKNSKGFLEMGFDEYFSKNGICLIEWSENIFDILPKNSKIIKLESLSETKRKVIIDA